MIRHNYMKKEIPLLLQEKDYTCGPACIRMVAAYYGIRRTEHYFEKIMNTTDTKGTHTANMQEGARSMGLDSYARTHVSIREIQNSILSGFIPIVLYFYVPEKEGHYAIVKKISRGRIFFIDPYAGANHSYSIRYFLKIWHGAHERKKKWSLFVRKESSA